MVVTIGGKDLIRNYGRTPPVEDALYDALRRLFLRRIAEVLAPAAGR